MKILVFLLSILSFPAFAPGVDPVSIETSALCVRARELRDNLRKYVSIPRYQRRGRRTFCNILAVDAIDSRDHSYWGNGYGFMIDDYSYDVSSVFPSAFSVLSMSIKEAYSRAVYAIARDQIKALTCREAFYSAQDGDLILIVSARWRHMAIVYPKEGEFPGWGCTIAQAGYYNGIFWISGPKVFGRNWKSKEILFLKFPNNLTL
jgi:hypothetical protein